MQVLACSISGLPFRWITSRTAAKYYAKGKVAWDIGGTLEMLRGGHSRAGIVSEIAISPIIAIANSHCMSRVLEQTIPLGHDNTPLYKRDRYCCAYCGGQFVHHELSRDHILATSGGGLNNWMNCVTACRRCNQEKADRLVEDFKPLLYLPYAPCRFENYLLTGRHILADQHEYLAANLPKHSRLS